MIRKHLLLCSVTFTLSMIALDAAAQALRKPDRDAPATCASLTAKYPDAPCTLDLAKFREPDLRLKSLQERGIGGSGLFAGVAHIARTPAEFNALAGRVGPGDQIVLAAGTWSDADLKLQAIGEAERPILIRPQRPGSVTFAGRSSLTVSGANVIVHDLTFRGGSVPRNNFIVLRLGGGVGRPCDGCIVDKVTVDAVNPDAASNDTISSTYLELQGRDITVANSTFVNKRNVGTVVHSEHPIANQCDRATIAARSCQQRLHFVGNTLSDVSEGVRRTGGVHKVKLMEIGSGYTAAEPAYSIIENNLFRHADGGTNTVVIKTSDVIVRGNKFIDNLGVLNLRSSSRTLVIDNLFDGSNKPGMGGVLVQGSGHWIVGNTFRSLSTPLNPYHYPIAMPLGAYEDLANNQKDYARVKGVVIAGNTFERVVKQPIAVGIFPNAQRGRALQPADVLVVDNTFNFAGANSQGGALGDGEFVLRATPTTSATDGVILRGNSRSR